MAVVLFPFYLLDGRPALQNLEKQREKQFLWPLRGCFSRTLFFSKVLGQAQGGWS
jgi:hypothetical protein